MKHALKGVAATCALLFLAAIPAAQAQSDVVSIVNPDPANDAQASTSYWTPERFRAAKPFPMGQVVPGASGHDKAQAAKGQAAGNDGQPPAVDLAFAGEQLFEPASDATAPSGDEIATPHAVGTLGAHYTSSRVFPMFDGANASFSADRAYPYRPVGVLFFSVNGKPNRCSAAVIERRVVVTAGHCIHNGTPGGFFSNFVFVPAYRDGVAPFAAWRNWKMASTTLTWANGGGFFPNAADYAMIVFRDQQVTPGGPVFKVGRVTGWLGWQTLSLDGNHTSKLSYPCNLDNCSKMQIITSNSFRPESPNTVQYGSDAREGSSGGPWVQNFERPAVGGGTGLNTALNRVVGVGSYVFVDLAPKIQGASIPDERWERLLNVVCAGAGNCSD